MRLPPETRQRTCWRVFFSAWLLAPSPGRRTTSSRLSCSVGLDGSARRRIRTE